MSADRCARCGAPNKGETGIAGLCWPPGNSRGYKNHHWGERVKYLHGARKQRDRDRLEAWTKAVEELP